MRAREALAEARRVEQNAPVLGDEAAAVEDEPVVRADEVRVGDGALVVGGARRDHLAARLGDAEPERGGREVDDDLGPRVAAAAHRPVGRPDVLADLERRRAEVEVEDEVAEGDAVATVIVDEPGDAARERARLVEDVVESGASPSARARGRARAWTSAAQL